jgi:hypothetical protein
VIDHEDVIFAEEGEEMTPDVMRAWCEGRNVTVWAITEGSDLSGGPLMCCNGLAALDFTGKMSTARIFAEVDLLPCCQNPPDEDGEVACIRDQFDAFPTRALEVLLAASAPHGIEWPEDIAGPAPEAS